MSVVSVQEMPVGRNGTPEETADNRTVSRQWLVTVNNPNDNIFTIVNDGNYFSSGIPSYLSPHPANVFYTCRSVELDPQSPLHWYAIATYSTAPVSQEDRERNEQPNPLDRRLKFSVDTMNSNAIRQGRQWRSVQKQCRRSVPCTGPRRFKDHYQATQEHYHMEHGMVCVA